MIHSISLTVNGARREIELNDPRVTLLDLLRELLQFTGTKKGCDRGQCGACTVLVDGRRINACLALAVSLDGAEVLTIEGLAEGDRLHPVQAAFIAHDGFQCGFCTPGQDPTDMPAKIRRHPPLNKGHRKIFGIGQKPMRHQRDAALQGFNLTYS